MRVPAGPALRRGLYLALLLGLVAVGCSSEPGPGESASGSGSLTGTSASTAPATTAPATTAPTSPPTSGATGPTTLPTTPQDEEFGFGVIGDFGSGDENEHAVADEMRQWADDHPLDAVVTTGDNVYESGLPSEFDGAWNEPYGWVGERGIPVVASLGNHDVDDEGKTEELDLFGLPGRWYERSIGPVRFIVLDANQPMHPGQLDFLRAALAEDAPEPWTVVAFHQPAYSCSFHQSTPAVDEAWVPLFGSGGVDLVLNGHDHDYQRFPRTDGVTYVVQGSGGNDLYPVSPILCPKGTPDPAFSDDDHHLFLYLSATNDRLTGQAITSEGEVVDTFEVPQGR